MLDLGCGSGATCVWAAQRGTRRVVGADIQSVELMRRKLASDYPELAGVVELRKITDGSELDGELFDVVLSKNTFEHVGDPESYVGVMQAHAAPSGHVVIGFSPLWKSPLGGHIGFMTKFPWAHLLFPEDVIMAERKRFRPNEDAQRFEQIRGGLNRMTLARFEQVMAASGLEPTHFEVRHKKTQARRHRHLGARGFQPVCGRRASRSRVGLARRTSRPLRSRQPAKRGRRRPVEGTHDRAGT